MRTGTQGPGRQIQDKSYYLGELRGKIAELKGEIGGMQGECDQFQKDNSTYSQAERRYESLVKEVRNLQGQLADFNLIVDKLRTNAEPADIAQAYHMLKQKNDQDRARVDAVFTERAAKDKQTRESEEGLQAIQREAEQTLNELNPDKRQHYQRLQENNKRLLDELSGKQEEYDGLCRQLAQYEQELNREPLKQRMFSLEQQRLSLMARKRELDDDANKEPLSLPEARERLLLKVKEDNALISSMEKQTLEVQSQVAKLREQVQQYDVDMDEAKGMQSEQKVKELMAKDKEMQEFIDGFEEQKSKDLENNVTTKETIVALLEHISRGLERTHNMPSQNKLTEMQDDLAYKEKQMDHAASTFERLQQELELRNLELEKINTLDSKISVELHSLNERMKTMRDELLVFVNLEGLKVASVNRKQELTVLKGSFSKRKDTLKLQVQQLSAKYETKKAKLAENETASTLEALEQKLRHYEQNIFHLGEYVETKTRESEYSSLFNDVTNLCGELNTIIVHNNAVAFK